MADDPQDAYLFIAPDTLSAAAQSFGAAKEIRRKHRKARIVCLCTPDLAALFEAAPYFNALETDGAPATGKEAAALVKRLRTGGFAGVYDFQGSSLSSRVARGVRPRPRFISAPVRSSRGGADRHAMLLLEAQLASAGVIEPGTRVLPEMSWLSAVGRRTRTVDPAYFGLNEPYAVLMPCAEEREGLPPVFKPEEWAELAAALQEGGLRPVLVGMAADRDASEAVRAAVPDARTFLGRTNLVQFASLCRNSSLTVSALAPSADLAAASGANLITTFCAGDPDPVIAAPRGEGAAVALTPGAARVGVADVLQSARVMGAFEARPASVDA